MTQSNVNPQTWVEEYGQYLYRYALSRLRDPAAADDVVQETFLAGVKGLHRFDGRSDVKYWLRGILHNKIVDYIRKAVRETPVEDPEQYQQPDTALMKYSGIPTRTPKPWPFDLHESFDRQEFWEIFNMCLSKLKGPLQQAFTLKELEGVKTEEICKALNVTPNNLWVMIYRARNQLKKCLEHNWD